MASLDHIRTRGFRRWYERQLIECHAWLVSCFLGMIATASGMELAGQPGPSRPTGIALIFVGVIGSIVAWKRYRDMLAIAERLGERAVCPSCGAYSRFTVLASGPNPMPDGADPEIGRLGEEVWMRARCKNCSTDWLL